LLNLLCFGSLEVGTQSLVLGIPQVGNKGHLNGQLSEKENAQLFLRTVTNKVGLSEK
jgi:hypothetical protein